MAPEEELLESRESHVPTDDTGTPRQLSRDPSASHERINAARNLFTYFSRNLGSESHLIGSHVIPTCEGVVESTLGTPLTAGSPTTSSSVDGLATLGSPNDNDICLYGESSTIALVRYLRRDLNPPVRSLYHQKTPERLREDDYSAFIYPCRQIADDYVKCYLEFIHPVFPVIHLTSFLSTYESFWLPPTELNASHDADFNKVIFVTILHLVFSLGCQFSNKIPVEKRLETAELFYRQSRKAYVFDCLDSASLSQVQVLLLNGIYLQSTQNASRCWNSVGLAIRTAQSLGIDVETPRVNSQLDREMCRRIWYTCVALDR